MCHMWCRNCLPFCGTRVRPRYFTYISGVRVISLSNYMSSHFWFCVVMYATVRRCSCRSTVTRRVSHAEEEFLILPEHLSALPVFSWVRVVRSLVLCVMFVIFLLAIVLSVILRSTDLCCPFCICKHFCQCLWIFHSWLSHRFVS